jgi:hypothetical protein
VYVGPLRLHASLWFGHVLTVSRCGSGSNWNAVSVRCTESQPYTGSILYSHVSIHQTNRQVHCTIHSVDDNVMGRLLRILSSNEALLCIQSPQQMYSTQATRWTVTCMGLLHIDIGFPKQPIIEGVGTACCSLRVCMRMRIALFV